MARRFHLFPFRTEKLSPATPMVLRNSGRVGSCRFSDESPVSAMRRGISFFVHLHLSPVALSPSPLEKADRETGKTGKQRLPDSLRIHSHYFYSFLSSLLLFFFSSSCSFFSLPFSSFLLFFPFSIPRYSFSSTSFAVFRLPGIPAGKPWEGKVVLLLIVWELWQGGGGRYV